MDPLSVSMAIVGLLSAAFKISSTLNPLISKSKNAPKDMKDMTSTVETIRSVLSQLQLMLLGRMKVDRERTSLILVDQIVVTLSACVATFSDLDVFTESLASDDKLGLMDRFRWATKAATVQEHCKKLEEHKTSLILMMTILTCDSTYKAEDAVDQLAVMTQRILDDNRLIAERLASLEVGLGNDLPDHLPPAGVTYIEPQTIQRSDGGFTFEVELAQSWVYKRSSARSDRNGAFSVISSAGRTASWSMLSGLSLADNITIIAVQALPIYAHDINNSDLYQFGQFDNRQNTLATPLTSRESQDSVTKFEPTSSLFRGRLNKFEAKFAIKNYLLGEKLLNTDKVFGVELITSMNYAKMSISSLNKKNILYVCGYLPLIVGEITIYLKSEGLKVPNIFSQNGSAPRIRKLEIIFDTCSPGKYGRDIVWSGYSVHDAASCLLRYFKLLPQPVIPFDFYETFVSCFSLEEYKTHRLSDAWVTRTIRGFRDAIIRIPLHHRTLLLFLLDICRGFAWYSDQNRMTPERLVAVFQPSLLSRQPDLMTAEDHAHAAEILVFMIENEERIQSGKRLVPLMR